MTFKKKLSLGLITAIACTIIFNGCKKDDKQQETQNDIERIRAEVRKQPFAATSVVNLQGKGFYGDIDGNPVTITHSGKSTNGMSTMGAGCPDPGDETPAQTLVYASIETLCGQGYVVEVAYDLTLVYSPVLTNGTVASFGRIRLKDASGTVIWPTVAPLPKYNVVSIENRGEAGLDPFGLMQTTYRVTFRSDIIAESTFSGAVTMEPYLFTYTDCPNIPTFICPFNTYQYVATALFSQTPCNRTDKVYYNGSSGGPDPSISGIANNLYCSSGYQFPTSQEIVFLNSTGDWVPFYLYGISYVGTTPRNVISSLDIVYIDVAQTVANSSLVRGNVKVKYRNQMSSGCSSGWVYDTWYIQ